MRTLLKTNITILSSCGKILIEHKNVRGISKRENLGVSFMVEFIGEDGKVKERSFNYNGLPFVIEQEQIEVR